MKKLFLFFLVFFNFIACVAAENSPVFTDSTKAPGGFDVASRVPVTVISLILVGALAWLILKFMGSKNLLPSMQGKNIKIIERQMISQKHFLLIVKVFDKYLLVGASDNNINTLKELDTDEVEKYLNCRDAKSCASTEEDKKQYWSKLFSGRIPFGKK